MQQRETQPPALDFAPESQETLTEVLRGLAEPQKRLPTRLLYDARGSELFEQICALDEYYLTRTEIAILEAHGESMARCIGPGCQLIEYGSGAGVKTGLVLGCLERPVAYVPIEISPEALRRSAAALARRYPDLAIMPICADYLGRYELPQPPRPAQRRVVFFPGSTIGNFDRAAALDFLRHIRNTCGDGGGALIGVDLHKDTETLERAYDDSQGVTAEFELNALAHLNREHGAEFELDRFRYESFYNESERRVEMYLASREAQRVRVGKHEIEFAAGERILLEYSMKFTLEDFGRLAEQADFAVERVWTDPDERFSVQFLVAR